MSDRGLSDRATRRARGRATPRPSASRPPSAAGAPARSPAAASAPASLTTRRHAEPEETTPRACPSAGRTTRGPTGGGCGRGARSRRLERHPGLGRSREGAREECHRGQLTFEGKHGIDLGEIAAALAAELAARPAHDCEQYARLVEREPGLVSFYRCERCGYVLPDEQEGEGA